MKKYILFLLPAFLLISMNSFGANRYWVAGSSSNWNNTANWSTTSGGGGGSSVPGSNDDAIFDGNGLGSCSIDATVNVKGMNVGAGYSGTISQGSNTISVGVNNGVFSGGTFSGGSANITFTGTCTISGCAFTSTSGTFSTNSNFTYSSGSFTHNSGKMKFTATSTITGSVTMYQLEFAPTSTATFTIATGTTLTVTNTLTMSGSSSLTIDDGDISAQGNIVITNTGTGAGGDATITVNGSGNQTLDGSAAGNQGRLPHFVINKSGGTLYLQDHVVVSGNWTRTAGDTDPGSSTVNMSGTKTITGVDTFYNLNFGSATYTVVDTLCSTHELNIGGISNCIIDNGILRAWGDVISSNTATGGGGTATIIIDSTANQTLTGSGTAAQGKLPNITINKSSGTLTLSSFISCAGNWIYTQGTVSSTGSTVGFYGNFNLDGQAGSSGSCMPFYNIRCNANTRTLTGNVDCNNDFIIGTSGTCSAGSYKIYVGGNWNSAGTWTYGTSTVVFDGNNYNKIEGATGTINFARVEISRTTIVGGPSKNVRLLNPVLINTAMTFNRGRIYSTTTNYLAFADNATCTVTNNDSAYVHGPVRKTGNDAFSFPLGDTTLADNIAYHPLAMTAPGSATDQFEAIYRATGQTAGSAKAATLTSISSTQYWTMERKVGSSTPTVTLSWNANGDNTAFAEMRVAEWTGSQWTDRGQGSTSITNPTGTLTASAALSFGANPAPLVIAYAVVSKSYAVLHKSEPASGYHSTDGYVLYFGFEDEYDDTNDSLTFRVVKLSNDRSSTLLPTPANTPLVRYGTNCYKLDLYDNTNTPLASGYYMLEVTNEKNETWYLRFKI